MFLILILFFIFINNVQAEPKIDQTGMLHVDFREAVQYLAPAGISPPFPLLLPPNPPTIAPPTPTLIPTTPPTILQYEDQGNQSFQFANPNTPPVRDDLQVIFIFLSCFNQCFEGCPSFSPE